MYIYIILIDIFLESKILINLSSELPIDYNLWKLGLSSTSPSFYMIFP